MLLSKWRPSSNRIIGLSPSATAVRQMHASVGRNSRVHGPVAQSVHRPELIESSVRSV